MRNVRVQMLCFVKWLGREHISGGSIRYEQIGTVVHATYRRKKYQGNTEDKRNTVFSIIIGDTHVPGHLATPPDRSSLDVAHPCD